MRAWGRRIAFVLQFYTVIPIRAHFNLTDEDCAWSLALSPLAGALIGLITVIVYALVSRFLFPLAAVIAGLFAMTFLSGAMHLDGLADTCDGIFCRKDAKAALEIMKDSRTGTFGALGLIFYFLISFALLAGAELNSYYYMSLMKILFLLPVCARMSMAVAAASAGPAREDGMGRAFIRPCGWPHALIAFLLASVLCAAADPLFVIPAFAAALWGFLCARFFHRRFGGLTGDLLGAICVTGELVTLILCLIIKAG